MARKRKAKPAEEGGAQAIGGPSVVKEEPGSPNEYELHRTEM